MPFITLNNEWSDLARYYNQDFDNKPEIPAIRYTSFDDGLIRGGIVNAQIASTRDTVRIGKFFASGKGALFVTKQVGLQLTNPELPAPGTLKLPTSGQGTINNAVNTVVNFINDKSPNQIYNLGLNTLAQIPLTAFGGHVIRQGKTPVFAGGYLEGSDANIKGYNYERITLTNNVLFSQTNTSTQSRSNSSRRNPRISTAENPIELDEVVVTSGLSYSKSPNRLLQYLKNVIKSGSSSKTKGNPVTLLEYNGGGSSTYGIGKTRIVTYPKNHTDLKSSDKTIQLNGFNNGIGYEVIDSISRRYSSLRNEQSYVDMNSSLENGELSTFNIESRVGVSKVGAYKYTAPENRVARSVDAINTITIMSSSTFYGDKNGSDITANMSTALFTYTSGSEYQGVKVTQGKFGRDIIKFRIEFLDNDSPSSGLPNTSVLAFRAYIDDFNDGFSAKWDSYRYMGRGEEFYVYNGFTRDISVSFTIYAHAPEEMAALYTKLNYLMSTFTPDYNNFNKMRGNIAYLTVGDYIYRQPGIFTDMKLSGMLDTHWEIAYNDNIPSNSPQYEVPKHIKVSLSFKPIHTFLPRKVRGAEGADSPFVTIDKRAYKAQAGGAKARNKYLDSKKL